MSPLEQGKTSPALLNLEQLAADPQHQDLFQEIAANIIENLPPESEPHQKLCFIRNLIHEINNPLTSIKIASELLLTKFSSLPPSEEMPDSLLDISAKNGSPIFALPPAIKEIIDLLKENRNRLALDLGLPSNSADFETIIITLLEEISQSFSAMEILLASHFQQRPTNNDQKAKQRKSALRGIQRAKETINFFKMKLEKRAYEIRPRPVAITEIVNLIEKEASDIDAGRGILDFSLGESLVGFVRADLGAIRTVTGNLISNACKYRKRGEKKARVDGRFEISGNFLKISFTDQGRGIPAKDLDKLFKEESRAEDVVKEGIPGMGLGLTICQTIIEAHDGQIWAESPGPGEGATFTFTIPLEKNHHD